ncbi:hypothetical protein DK880_00847 [Candidatus Cardinium hertigii]|uniref:Uncharacterized protein n=1 Tax=Candidatus Cardinium hertigii TaxID=247481 RepID=A0A2Z3L9D5_9BACT|nr:hypothetical protein DK880_00847 [Candidatus Cardinium hertigii]
MLNPIQATGALSFLKGIPFYNKKELRLNCKFIYIFCIVLRTHLSLPCLHPIRANWHVECKER